MVDGAISFFFILFDVFFEIIFILFVDSFFETIFMVFVDDEVAP